MLIKISDSKIKTRYLKHFKLIKSIIKSKFIKKIQI